MQLSQRPEEEQEEELPVRISNSSICAASPETSMRYVNLW